MLYQASDMSPLIIMGNIIFLLISVYSCECTSTSCISGSAHQQLQYQCVLGASTSQCPEWHHPRVQGENVAIG